MTAGADDNLRQALGQAQQWRAAGRRDLAQRQLAAILQARPGELNALCLVGVMHREDGRFDDAIANLEAVLAAAPDFHFAARELALAQRAGGRLRAAIRTLQALTARVPGDSLAWRRLGDALIEDARLDKGRAAFARAAQSDPHRPAMGQAMAALNQGRRDEAERVLKTVLQAEPDHVYSLIALGTLFLDAGAYDDAARVLEQARALTPNLDVIWRHLARLHFERSNFAEAALAARRAVDLAPDQAAAWHMLGDIQAWGAAPDLAPKSYEKALKLDSRQPHVWLALGHARKTLGQRAESEAAYKKAIAQSPGLGEAYWGLADLKTFSFGEDEIAAMKSLLDGPLAPLERANLEFALGKALEGRAHYVEAFDHYAAGNALRAALEPFDVARFEALVAGLKAAYSSLPERAADQGPTPIFIVGLPRSGSTLVEQILATHSRIQGAMELPHLSTYAKALEAQPGGYAHASARLDAAALAALGQRYLHETAVFHTQADFFIDKMPNNFVHAGLIARALPNALIIDVRRDPRDCGLSCFKQNFAQGQSFTYDLSAIGCYYRSYVDLMAHWDAVAPGRVIRVQYEALIADPDSEIARLLEVCGVAFEEACLRFNETRRAIRTPSAEQVRQPIYTSGVGYWRKFEAQLQPLIEALGPVAATQGRSG